MIALKVLNVRLFVVLFLLVSVAVLGSNVMRAGNYGDTLAISSAGDHPAGDSKYPTNDCGQNAFRFVRLPDDVCVTNVVSEKRLGQTAQEFQDAFDAHGEVPDRPELNPVYLALKFLNLVP